MICRLCHFRTINRWCKQLKRKVRKKDSCVVWEPIGKEKSHIKIERVIV